MPPKNRRLICSRPFTWFEVTTAAVPGQVHLCCPGWLRKPVGDLRYQTVEEIWNGEAAQEVRRSILRGTFEYCDQERCHFLQTRSDPVQYVENVQRPRVRKAISQGLTKLPYGPQDVICSYDRSCNLSCPSCRTKVIVEVGNRASILGIQRKLSDEALRDAGMLYITGSGDPFGSPFFRQWLQTMRRSDMPSLSRIFLHTNGLLWTPRAWAAIPREIQELVSNALISIDAATAATYELNRRGGRFERLLENLHFISQLRKVGPLRWLGINMVVQENNFREIPDFVSLGHRFEVDAINFSTLANWGTFSRQEYQQRAIHQDSHASHGELLDVLKNSALESSDVFIGNLASLRRRAMGGDKLQRSLD